MIGRGRRMHKKGEGNIPGATERCMMWSGRGVREKGAGSSLLSLPVWSGERVPME